MATQLQTPHPELDAVQEELELEDRSAIANQCRQKRRSAVDDQAHIRKALLLALVIVGSWPEAHSWWYLCSPMKRTDDAQVDGHLHPVSARISGTILRVNPEVEDSHFVQAGTVLAEIDPADYQAERDRARADYQPAASQFAGGGEGHHRDFSGSNGRLELANAAVSEAEDSVATEKRTLDSGRARLAQAEANYTRAETDRQRYDKLLAKHEISQSEYDRVATEADTDQSAVAGRSRGRRGEAACNAAQSRLTERKADLLAAGSAPQQIASSRAKAAAAVVRCSPRKGAAHHGAAESWLYQDYCSGERHHRPQDHGRRPARAARPAVADHHSRGRSLDHRQFQGDAATKDETRTAGYSTCGRDRARIITATLMLCGGATGSRFSLLPPENATGNYVKVVQRVPVRIRAGRRAKTATIGCVLECPLNQR